MRRLAARRFTVLSAASLLLCVATCGLWVRSYRVTDSLVHYSGEDDNYAIKSAVGGLYLEWTQENDPRKGVRWLHFTWPDGGRAFEIGYDIPSRRWQGVQVFDIQHHANLRTGLPPPTRYVVISYWLLAIVALVLPARWVATRRRARTRRAFMSAGRCPTCGYDLRATPARCPECGATPTPAGA